MRTQILDERKKSIIRKERGDCGGGGINCEAASVSGAVSQRACVYCGARVVLNPITDAFHLVHGPIGCASYTWDIRGSLTSGSTLFRQAFSTDLQERDIIFGGAEKLSAAIDEAMRIYRPKLIFVYATCIVGVIGDDVEAVCRQAEKKYGNRVVAVKAPGFAGHKAEGYRLAGNALMTLLKPHAAEPREKSINILGDYNLAGEMWIIKNYMREIGLPVISGFTGDASCDTLTQAPGASLNVVQCAGSMTHLARRMEEEFGIPWIKASFFGLEDATRAIMDIAEFFGDQAVRARAAALTQRESARAAAVVARCKPHFAGKKAAIFVGGGFKAISLIRQFTEMGIETVIVGAQTGKPEEYAVIAGLVNDDAVILDDANPAELEAFMKEKGADILVGGVKERPLAYKLGLAFCDHNHERKHPLAGYEGVVNFAREINLSINSPVWRHMRTSCRFSFGQPGERP
ncbi:MAG: nitrogenase iron-molybdenum cofactor biosynthesis protein NifE [Candidatus Adiutrix sp.]|jgi:nitrogenase molybdenum-cofactor synthesis protein NifE|nr:nitrogenase iron-molybdenum cofactor biosynthesis protein NifE [Candidatus Adiutrix sp.]